MNTRKTYKPRIYLHKYANGLKFWRVVPFEKRSDGLRYRHLTMVERDRHASAYEYVADRNSREFGKAGMYAA